MNEAVRAAADADVSRLLEMAEELSEAIGAQRGGPLLLAPIEAEIGSGPHGRRERWESLLTDESTLVLAGTLDEVVAGFGLCHVEDLGPPGRRGVLDACYVEVEARGVGLGRLLLDASVSWLEGRGCGGVDGIALPGDRGAKNFYEAAGFKARMLTMHRQID